MLDRTEVANAIQAVLNKNYNLVSDPTATNNFDHNDEVDQNFTVVFSKLPDASYTSVPVDEAGTPIPGTAPTSETGQPGSPVVIPTVPGYTPDTDQPVVPTDNGEVKVKYKPNSQFGKVSFVDVSGNALAPELNVTGFTDGHFDRTAVIQQIQQVINENYNLVQDQTEMVFNNIDGDNQEFKVVFSKLNHAQFTLIPTLPDGSSVPNYPESVSVTGLPGEKISAPDIPGYTAKTPSVDVPTTNPNVVITYTPNTQKATIHFVDDKGNSVANDLHIEGDSNSTLARSDVNGAIQAVLNDNYNLVSNPTATNRFDQNDDADQEFTISFSKLPDAGYTSVPVDEAGNPIPGTTPT
ncbi:hypothetical protein GM612_12155, partial [Lactobacillus sp. CRM56-3]|nr:hypothetical protein [Secundilactobacillus folii]